VSDYFTASHRDELLKENRELKDRIKRLEEALGEIELAMKQPASNHRLMQIAGPARQVINIIKKAKEAKL
jgi:cell division septum initiation protein DivIVA